MRAAQPYFHHLFPDLTLVCLPHVYPAPEFSTSSICQATQFYVILFIPMTPYPLSMCRWKYWFSAAQISTRTSVGIFPLPYNWYCKCKQKHDFRPPILRQALRNYYGTGSDYCANWRYAFSITSKGMLLIHSETITCIAPTPRIFKYKVFCIIGCRPCDSIVEVL